MCARNIRLTVISFSVLTGLAAAGSATPLPPVPDAVVFAQAAAGQNGGAVIDGGNGAPSARAVGILFGETNTATAAAYSDNLSKEAAGTAPTDLVAASASTTGDVTFADEADGTAVLDFWFRVTQTRPLPSGLSSIPVTLKVTASAVASGRSQGEVWLLPPDGAPSDGGNVLDTANGGQRRGAVTVNVSPDQVFQIVERAFADPDCKTNYPQCVKSIVVVDPFIAFDQQSFDALAAQLGVPSVPLDQFFSLDFSSGLSQLPSIPSNLGQDLGVNIDQLLGNPSAAAVPEPASLAVLATGLAGLGMVRRRRRA